MKHLLFLTLNLQYFSQADAGGGEGEQQTEQPEQQAQQQEQQKDEKVFTQKEVNNIVKKQTSSEIEKVLKAAGLTDFENAKDGLAKFKEWQDAQKTDAQKQAETLEQYQKDLDATKAEKEDLAYQLTALKLDADPEKLVDLIVLAKTRVKDDVTLDDAIKQTLDTYPQFKKQGAEQQQQQTPPPWSAGSTKSTDGNNDPFASKLAKYL